MTLFAIQLYSQEDNSIATVVEKPAEYIGGIEKLKNFIKANTQLPDSFSGNLELKVFTKFIVDTSGQTRDFKVLASSGIYLIDKKALQIISMTKWNPAELGGKKVPCYFNLPIPFYVAKKFVDKRTVERKIVEDFNKSALESFNIRNYGEAKVNYARLYGMNETNVDVLYNLGVSYAKLGMKDSACYCWKRMENDFRSSNGKKLVKEFCQ